MPCMQCEDGKWRWGNTGDCQYESQADCEAAHKGEHAEGDTIESQAYGAYPKLASLLFDTPLMIERNQLNRIMAFLGPKLNTEIPKIHGAYGSSKSKQRTYDVIQGSGIIPITGELTHRGSWLDAESGLTSYQQLKRQFIEAYNDSSVKSIIMDLDSPGGSASAVFDLVDMIYTMRQDKPIYAVVNESAYSAAYAIASAATKIYVPRTAGVGSIGVIAQHVDQSKYDAKMGFKVTNIFAGDKKADFNSHEPLSSRGHDTLQNMVNDTYALFVSTVARNRGMAEKAVRDTQAGIFISKSAVNAGLADSVASVDEAFSEIFNLNTRTKEKVKMVDTTKAVEETVKQNTSAAIDAAKQIEDAKAKAVSEAKASFQARCKVITDLCVLAGQSARANEFIASDKSEDDVREELLNAKASVSNSTHIDNTVYNSAYQDEVQAGWEKAVAKTNAVNKSAVKKYL
jgi:signal peptide peptidase SppA